MPIVRKSAIDPLYTVAQLLSHLQMEGHLDGLEMPDWAVGTSVEELINALKLVGDGAWLEAVYEGYGRIEAADDWIVDFLKGDAVPAPDDIFEQATDPAFDLEAIAASDGERAVMAEYLRQLGQQDGDRLVSKLGQDAGFAAAFNGLFVSLAERLEICALADDKFFKAHRFPFLEAAFPRDPTWTR